MDEGRRAPPTSGISGVRKRWTGCADRVGVLEETGQGLARLWFGARAWPAAAVGRARLRPGGCCRRMRKVRGIGQETEMGEDAIADCGAHGRTPAYFSLNLLIENLPSSRLALAALQE